MSTLPRDPSFDATLTLRADPYGFVAERARRLGADVFETRLGLQRTICMTGPEATELFYDTTRFERSGSLPPWIATVLFGRGGVQGLDGEAHRHRKAMYLAITAPEHVERLAESVAAVAASRIDGWSRADRVVLYDELQSIICEAACAWAGLPLPAEQVDRTAADMTTLFQWATSIGPRHWLARWVRRRLERWVGGIVDEARGGRLSPRHGSALAIVLAHRNLAGQPLDTHTVAVELLNVVRPTIAVAVFGVFAALALHRHPAARDALGDDDARECFALETRRFFPFFPVIAAKVRDDFEWNGYEFPRGRRVLLDVYGTNHDPRAWDEPDDFRPDRFRGRDVGPFEYVPQGGGDVARNHRCPGERIAIEIVKVTTRLLTERINYSVPEQDLEVDRASSPALPASGFVIADVRART